MFNKLAHTRDDDVDLLMIAKRLHSSPPPSPNTEQDTSISVLFSEGSIVTQTRCLGVANRKNNWNIALLFSLVGQPVSQAGQITITELRIQTISPPLSLSLARLSNWLRVYHPII